MSHRSTPTATAVTIGEPLGLVLSSETGGLRVGAPARLGFAGAESNVAIGLARLGHDVAYISRVGDDEFGRMIRTVLAGEGIDTRFVIIDVAAPTGLMFRSHRTADRLRVEYYRRASAACHLTPSDISEALIRGARVLHISGITVGISKSAREAVLYAVSVAHAAGVTVSLDVNHRNRIWNPTDAGAALRTFLGSVDLVFGSGDELSMLSPSAASDPADAAEHILRSGPSTVVWKRGFAGATAFSGSVRVDIGAVPVTQIDPVGAGDAFVAGYLSSHLDGHPMIECLGRAAECGAFAVSVDGDWEGLPRREELGTLSAASDVDR